MSLLKVDNIVKVDGSPLDASRQEVASPGSTTSRSLEDRFADVINVKDFGAIGDGVTDDTSAIQDAINYASNNGGYTVYAPAGVYSFSRLLFHYDAVLNTGFNQSESRQGAIRLLGDGRMSKLNYNNDIYAGTVLVATDTESDVLWCDGRTSSDVSFNGDGFRIEELSLVAETSGRLIFGDRTPQNSGVKNCLVIQNGSGSGIEFKDGWFLVFEGIFAQGVEGLSAGCGFWVHNEDLSGGFVNGTSIACVGFNTGVYMGHDDRASAARLHNVHLSAVQGSSAEVGVVIGGGIESSTFKVHVENTTLGVKVIHNAKRVELSMTTSNNDKDLEVGSADSAENYVTQLTVKDSNFLSQGNPAVEIFSGSNCIRTTIKDSAFTSPSGTTAMKVQDTSQLGLDLRGLEFNDSYSTTIENSQRTRHSPYMVDLTDTLTLSAGFSRLIVATTGGSNRVITLPDAEVALEYDNDFIITNADTGDETIVVRDQDNAITYATLASGESKSFYSTGLGWVVL